MIETAVCMRSNIIEIYTAIQSEGSRRGMPTIVVRTTGCTHRCCFGEGGWCDTWYTSIHPEKAKYTIDDVYKIVDNNLHISEMMVTGGSPTMHPDLLEALMVLADVKGLFVTLETEGSHFVKTTNPIDLISISPKFSSSVPVLGSTTPGGKVVDQKFIDLHNRKRLNIGVIESMIEYHRDYHFKPVWGGGEEDLKEILEFKEQLGIPNSKTWIMPAGDNRDALIEIYPVVMEKCVELGVNFSSREHIIAYNDKRCV